MPSIPQVEPEDRVPQLMSDGDYLRAMASLQDANIGPPARDHSNRLRAIASRVDGISDSQSELAFIRKAGALVEAQKNQTDTENDRLSAEVDRLEAEAERWSERFFAKCKEAAAQESYARAQNEALSAMVEAATEARWPLTADQMLPMCLARAALAKNPESPNPSGESRARSGSQTLAGGGEGTDERVEGPQPIREPSVVIDNKGAGSALPPAVPSQAESIAEQREVLENAVNSLKGDKA